MDTLKAILFSGYGLGMVGILVQGIAGNIAQKVFKKDIPIKFHIIYDIVLVILSVGLIIKSGV